MRGWMVLGVMLLAAQSPPCEAAGRTRFAIGDQGGILVKAMLNGAGPFTLLLDTGAAASVISEEVARLIGAPPVAQATVISPAGHALRVVVRVDRLQLGPITAEALLPTVVPRSALAATGVDGLLGQDVLSGLRYTIDFPGSRIVWHDDEELPAGSRVVLAMSFSAGRYLVDLPQPRSMLRLVPDSGAGGLVLFGGTGRDLPPVTVVGGRVDLWTLEGRRLTAPVLVRELRVGSSTLRDLPAVVLNRPEAGFSEGDGLLPLKLFGRVTFDGPSRRLILG